MTFTPTRLSIDDQRASSADAGGRHVSGRTLLCVVLSLVPLTSVQGAQEPEAAEERISLVVFAPRGPVIVDLEITVSRQPWRVWVAGFLSEKLDVDRSGGLTTREMSRIPERLAQMAGAESATELSERAAQSGIVEPSTEAPRDRFNSWFSDQLARTMQVIAQAVPPSDAVRLGELLDADGDGSVDPEELVVGVETLRFRDLDDDQTLSATELLPFRDPRNQLTPVTPDAADLPFIQLDSEESLQQAAERIVRRYGDDSGQISFRLMRTHPQLLASHDANSDRAFDADELRAYLQHRSAHLTWKIQLSDRAAGSRIEIQASPYARRFSRIESVRAKNGSGRDRLNRKRLLVDDMPIEIRSHGGSATVRRDLLGYLGQHFAVADDDNDSLLSTEEFEAMSSSLSQVQLDVDFARADIDEDQFISRDELNAWVETDALATQSRIEISVRQDGRTLFALLDRNLDRRLAQRELQEGQSVLEEFDVNEDGKLAEGELGTSYVLRIGLGRPEWNRQGPQMMTMEMTSTDAILPGIDSLTGPQWFRRMDRNQDGDLSRREFLGTREQFDRLDSDADQLIDAEEAEAISAD